MKSKSYRFLKVLLLLFLIMNIVAFFHAYKFTHFKENKSEKTQSPEKLSTFGKVKTLFLGVNNPKPKNSKFPSQSYTTLKLKSNKEIECWHIRNAKPKGTVILFHGYGSEKSSLIERSDEFQKLGYSTMLVDFMGSGNSDGNQTTIGFKEAKEVKSCFDYIASIGETNIYLFGSSMGAAAIMKSIKDYQIKPKGIIIECPFGSMYKTVCARFKKMNAPTFPMAGLLVFWGGIQNGFWGFEHNPAEYAKHIECPALLLYGEKDKSVSRQEIDDIFTNLKGSKDLKVYKNTGHENYLIRNKIEWSENISHFLMKIK
ncbi:alpha/beta hydrolase [Flavobacterium hungaricum]|uniref:Alpha/beta hydrolase n=1 Tax=Flavobacterium hungaricum TaxID=2082725 RepID=A0ABR9TE36_9FLAO|nr:alpha/beta hydrolase [Flavobacterium hungaricum]MBE8723617.1 alpha/beta hydrolase [Flavobacterium hungaricum]